MKAIERCRQRGDTATCRGRSHYSCVAKRGKSLGVCPAEEVNTCDVHWMVRE